MFEPVVHFSGGERARLALAILVAERPNLLLLDEPTNHLDFEMRHSLITALQDFAGAVIVVSHDRGLLRSVCDQFWLVADGAVTRLRGRPRGLLELAREARQRRFDAGRAQSPRGEVTRDADKSAKRPTRATTSRPSGRRSSPSRRRWTSSAQERARLEKELAGTRLQPRRRACAQGHGTPRGAGSRSRATGDTLAGAVRAARIAEWLKSLKRHRSIRLPRRRRRDESGAWDGLFAYGFLALWLLIALWNLFKPLPDGVSIRGTIVETPLNQLQFLTDVTGADVFGAPVVRQQIFDSVFALIGQSREYLVLDFFLFNDQRGAALDAKPHRELSTELRDALLARKRAMPQMHILVIADPINDVYGGLPSRDLAALRGAGIDVVTPDLDALRDSNPYLLIVLAPDDELVGGRRLG